MTDLQIWKDAIRCAIDIVDELQAGEITPERAVEMLQELDTVQARINIQ